MAEACRKRAPSEASGEGEPYKKIASVQNSNLVLNSNVPESVDTSLKAYNAAAAALCLGETIQCGVGSSGHSDTLAVYSCWHKSGDVELEAYETFCRLSENLRSLTELLSEIQHLASSDDSKGKAIIDNNSNVYTFTCVALPCLLSRLRSDNRKLVLAVQISDKLLDDAKSLSTRITKSASNIQREMEWVIRRVSIEDSFCTPIYDNLLSEMDEQCYLEKCRHKAWWVANDVDSHNYHINWLMFEKAEREKSWKRFDEMKKTRQEAENRVAEAKKKEIDLLSQIAPIGQKLNDLYNVLSLASSQKTHAIEVIPRPALCLPAPLLAMYTQFFAYRSITGDKSIRLQTTKHEDTPISLQLNDSDMTTKINSQLCFIPHDTRVAVEIGSGPVVIPPISANCLWSMFPITLWFTHFPHLDVFTAVCYSPIKSNPQSRYNLLDDIINGFDTTTSPSTCVSPDVADILRQNGFGVPYTLLQNLGKIKVTSANSCSSVTGADKSEISITQFIAAIRQKVALRSWTIYQIQSFKTSPNNLNVTGVNIPVHLLKQPVISKFSNVVDGDIKSSKCFSGDFPAANTVENCIFVVEATLKSTIESELSDGSITVSCIISIPLITRICTFRLRVVFIRKQLKQYFVSSNRYTDKEAAEQPISSDREMLPAGCDVFDVQTNKQTHYKDDSLKKLEEYINIVCPKQYATGVHGGGDNVSLFNVQCLVARIGFDNWVRSKITEGCDNTRVVTSDNTETKSVVDILNTKTPTVNHTTQNGDTNISPVAYCCGGMVDDVITID